MSFYARVVNSANIDSSDRVLAICAGRYDRDVLMQAGIRDAVISNVDYHAGETDYSPYEWQYQDAENISLDDAAVHWCVVNAGLHHCGSPHHALCEMLRVSSKGIVVCEARDSGLMRLAVRLGLTSEYELEPAALSGGTIGGFRNSHIPNYVYRWTEREVTKTVSCFLPHITPAIEFSYGYRLPFQRLAMERSFAKRAFGHIGVLIVRVLRVISPKQGNEFGFVVRKTGEIKPWLLSDGKYTSVNTEYILRRYNVENYKKTGERD